MKKGLLIIILSFIVKFSFGQQFTDLYGDYLGQTPPGDTPVVFARGIVSIDTLNEHSPAIFSPDGNELFWWVNFPPKSENEKGTVWGMTMQRIGDRWTAPIRTNSFVGEPSLSIDGKRLYFSDNGDIWFIEKNDNGWSQPKSCNIIKRNPELERTFMPSIANNGTLYFMGIDESLGTLNNYALYRAKLINGDYTKAELLPHSINLPPYINWTPYIAPDESYLMFSRNINNGDLFIAFHDTLTDAWTKPVDMGDRINTSGQERLPSISPDGKYLFFTRNDCNNHHDIFWVSSKIIDDIKKEVFNSKLSPKEIHYAAAAGDLEKVRALLEADPTLLESKDDRLSYKGNTPLISACWGPGSNKWQAMVANFLIDKGANINTRNDRGATPLYFSIKDFDLTQRLINMGAEVNIRAYGDFTPLHQCKDIKVAKLLIDHGADPNASGAEGTVIQFIIRMNRPNEQMIKLLIEGGAKLNQKFSFGNTELHLAVFNGLADVIPVLVKYGADVNAVNEYGHTPLYYATMHGYRKVADALIIAGAEKSSITESNYDKAPQLSEKLTKGEAYLWYLGGKITPCTGYAVKTKKNLLIFNPTEVNKSSGVGLANGYLNPNELAGLKITAFILYKSYQGPLAPSVPELAKRLSVSNFVLNFKPDPDTVYNNYLPLYKLASPHENFTIGNIQVHTIPAIGRAWFAGEGLSYLVEADGVKIFHAGLHVPGNKALEIENYRKEIDYLKPFGPIDIVILPINSNHVWWINYESYYYLIDQLAPKAVYLIGDGSAKNEHKKCLEILKARNVPVFYPDGGIAVGQRFHYLRNGTKK